MKRMFAFSLLVILILGNMLSEASPTLRVLGSASNDLSLEKYALRESAVPEFLYQPFHSEYDYLSTMSAMFDHSNPNYTTDNKIIVFSGFTLKDNCVSRWWNGAVAPDCQGDIRAYEDTTWEIPRQYYDGHDGYDWAVGGQALAAGDGVVDYVGWKSCLGYIVRIDHGNDYRTTYGHLEANSPSDYTDQSGQPIRAGSRVTAGSPIGRVGNTTQCGTSTGPHLHFMVEHWQWQNESWEVTDPFGWDYSVDPVDPLVQFNGEMSHNLWSGGAPHPVGGPPSLPPSVAPNGQYMGGWLGPITPSGAENAVFVSDITYPDGTVVSPSQSIVKTWRLRNTGTTTWNSGYQLVFISGEQMNAPSAVDLSSTAPGSTADISINLTAPASQGEHSGYWQLRNPQGTYFGPTIWVKINVSDGTGGGGTDEISLTCLDCPAIVSPGYIFRPTIRARVNSGQLQGINLRGDHLRNTDGNLFGAHPLIAVTGNTIVNPGQVYNFTFYQDNPIHAPETPGTYESKWRVWRGNNYAGQELTIRFEVRVGGGVNRAPNRPSLVSPSDWATFLSGSGISLQAQHNGDPDGDSINGYYFEVFTSGPIADSGWTSSNSWTPPSLGFENFQWRVKVRDQYNSESEWSEIRHFTVENNEPQVYNFYSMTCRPAWNQGEPEKICFCSDTNAGTQRLQVNTAPDGSENGEWIVLNEIGTPDYTCSSDNDRPPTWGHLPFDPGHYRVRLYARRDGGWAAAAHRDIFVDLPADRRPDTPSGTPANVYLNSRTVHFDWVDTKRTSNYQLIISLNADLSNPLVNTILPTSTSEYTYTFPLDYETVYWNVKATGSYGENSSGSLFHIDVAAPQSAIAPLPAITDAENFTVNWSGADDRSGIQWYAVQYREGNRPTSQWQDWLINTTRTNELFRGKLGETYYFRVRAMDHVGNWEAWPTGDGDAFVQIDPTAFPPPPYWNSAYAYRRALTVLNNDSDPIPAHYPIALHFDGTTSPTAAEIYNASIAAAKCDDLRIVLNHQVELDRFVQYCSPSRVVLVFPAQTAIGGGQTSSGEYHLYYGNAAAVNPPANLNNVFVPEADANTMGLWHFQEGAGSTVYDSSGRGHHGTFYNSNWADGYLGRAGSLNGSNAYIDAGNSTDFNNTAMTIEGWIYLNGPTGNWPPIITKAYNATPGGYEIRVNDGRKIVFAISTAQGTYGVDTSISLEPNRWYHFAAVHNGQNRQYIYVNGIERANGNSGVPTFGNAPVAIGYHGDGGGPATFPGLMQHFRISNVARYDFPYARLDTMPTVVAGTIQTPPITGTPDLSILDLATFPNIGGGTLVMATIQNMGTASTRNTFATDLYLDHVPTSAGDYTGSVRFWVNDPIAAGSTVTLTTVITDLVGVNGWVVRPLAPLSESVGTLYAQVDSTGAVSETNSVNNINLTGVEVCVAATDIYEGDDAVVGARPIVLGQVQLHNFSGPSDRDWVSFTAQGGMTYTLRTLNLGAAADTYLYLYGMDGTTLLASNDDVGGSLVSRIDWVAPLTGTYYALVQHWNPNVGGCGTRYELSYTLQQSTHKLYLPAVSRNAGSGGGVSPTSQIAFVSRRDGDSDIYTMNADGTNVVQLTVNGVVDEGPSYSADGTQIVFHSSRVGHNQLYTMKADGSNQTRLLTSATQDEWAYWSPSGGKIVFSRVANHNGDGLRSDVFLMNADGTNVTRLTYSVGATGSYNHGAWPSGWSSDGTQILFYWYREGNNQLWIMDADGGHQRKLTTDSYWNAIPTMSPDRSKIAFASYRDGNYEIYLMNADGTNAVRLTNAATEDWRPVWSADGKKIVFEANRDGHTQIYTMNPDGSQQMRLTNSLSYDGQVTWRRVAP